MYLVCVNFIFIDSVRALKGERGKDEEILAPVGITVTTDDGKILGMSNISCNAAPILYNA